MGEFQPEVANPRGTPLVDVTTGFLRLGAKNGVAASHVGNHRVGATGGILELDAVSFARAPAIAIAGTRREEPAEHTMFGVKNRQVLIRHYLDAFGVDSPREFANLRAV